MLDQFFAFLRQNHPADHYISNVQLDHKPIKDADGNDTPAAEYVLTVKVEKYETVLEKK